MPHPKLAPGTRRVPIGQVRTAKRTIVRVLNTGKAEDGPLTAVQRRGLKKVMAELERISPPKRVKNTSRRAK